jgi:hypothetical protein
VKSKRISLVVGVVALVILGIVFATLFSRERQLIRDSQPVQAALEAYRQQHSSYPESLLAANIPEPDELYYRRETDGSYILWFGKGLGESVTFHSRDAKWQ